MSTATITTRRRTIKPDSPRARYTLRRQIAERHTWLCHWCSRPLNEDGGQASNELYATIEHLIQRSQGGTNDLDNLRLACRRCNNERHANKD